MPSRFEQYYFENAMPMLQDNFGVAVKLVTASAETAEFVATYSKREDESIEFATGLPITIVSRDWYLPAAELVIDGDTIMPRAGMLVVETETGDKYEIQAIRDRPAAEPDLGGQTITVHSVRITQTGD